jgi:STE24 endopeptidase
MPNFKPARVLPCESVAAALLLAIAFLAVSLSAFGQGQVATPQPLVKLGPIPAAAQFDSSGHLDVEKATRAYLDTIPKDKQEASNKYFEGKYWLMLWDALFTIALMLILLFTGLSRRMSDWAASITRFRWLQDWIYFAQFTIVTVLIGFPLNYYEAFYREHIYYQSAQPFSGWLRDEMVGNLLSVLIAGAVVATLYLVVRRLPDSWHLWGAALTVIFFILVSMFAPVYLAPLFNTYKPIGDPQVTVPILKMAHANGIAVDKLYEVDASRQTTQVSANVSGLFGTTRITLNDNLLRTTSLEEIEDTAGHEMGHYVLNHGVKMTLSFGILIFIFFALLRVWLKGMQTRWGAKWGTLGTPDIAMLPAVVMAITVMSLLSTPITNTLIRTQEYEADLYGLNAARQPDGSAQTDLKLGQYRKMEPGPVEEFLFFDHPSGYTRIRASMQWKSENARTLKECAGY